VITNEQLRRRKGVPYGNLVLDVQFHALPSLPNSVRQAPLNIPFRINMLSNFSLLKLSFIAWLFAMLAGQSAMAQNVSLGTLNSLCSSPAKLYTYVAGRDPNRPELQTPVLDGDVLNAGEKLTVVLTTGVEQYVPHVLNCTQSVRLTHTSNFVATYAWPNEFCNSRFSPRPSWWYQFDCRQTTSTSIETQTKARHDLGETSVTWIAIIKPKRLQCLEQVPLAVSMGAEEKRFAFWIKNDYIIRKGRRAKCAKDLELSSALKASPF